MLKWLLIAVVICGVDQATKALALQHLVLHTPVPLVPGVNLELAFNKGAAFSMLANSAGWQQILFIGVGVIVSVVIIAWLKFLPSAHKSEGLALAFILGGALGNLWDRVKFGHVVDFIDVYYEHWHWYTFNIADAFITIGACLLIWTALLGRD